MFERIEQPGIEGGLQVRFYLIVLMFVNLLTAYGQEDLFFPLSNAFKWSDVETQNSDLKRKLIHDFPDEFEYYRQVRDFGPTMNDLDSCLHVMDFNNDGLDDLVFDGWSGGEPRLITIFINNGKSFDKVFSDYQGIHKLSFEDNRISKLYIQDWGCCCDYVVRNKVYGVAYDSTQPKVRLINQLEYVVRTEFPVRYFDKPVKFEVLNTNYKIRFAPVIDDTTEVGYCGELRSGNCLGRIKSGTIGYALSEKYDTTGRVWWFVALVPDAELSESMFYDLEGEPKSYKLGWISSRFVKRFGE